MIAKVLLFLAAVAAVQATALVGMGAPWMAGGQWGAAINHVAPVGYAYGHGMAAGPLGYGWGAGQWGGLGHGLASGNLRADGIVGNGVLGSRYGGVIGHQAVLGGAHYGGVLGLGYGLGHGKALL